MGTTDSSKPQSTPVTWHLAIKGLVAASEQGPSRFIVRATEIIICYTEYFWLLSTVQLAENTKKNVNDVRGKFLIMWLVYISMISSINIIKMVCLSPKHCTIHYFKYLDMSCFSFPLDSFHWTASPVMHASPEINEYDWVMSSMQRSDWSYSSLLVHKISVALQMIISV